MSLSAKADSFPRAPGIYLFKDSAGKVLYVGKAKNLRNRIRSYFIKGRDDRPQISFLIKRTADIDFIITDSEKEALLLENTLIKEHRPRYNIHLRDDKSYVSIRLNLGHSAPGISLTRKPLKDGAKYFGPYDSSIAAREACEQIQRHFRVRSCTDREFANRIRPCLKYDIGRCTAPCVNKVTTQEYALQIKSADMFLAGHSAELIKIMKSRMRVASENMEYEEAANLRDAIAMMESVQEKQKVVKHAGGDIDAIGISRHGDSIAICCLEIRSGLLKKKRGYHYKEAASDNHQLIEEFILRKYVDSVDIPSKILLSEIAGDLSDIENLLSEQANKNIRISIPERGEMASLARLASTNAEELLKQHAAKTGDLATLELIGQKLGIPQTPHRIECLDISNMQGRDAVGSLVSFVDGRPDKLNYRIYNIRSLDTPDDYAMMKEVIERRFIEVGKNLERPFPDLFLVDGGKGQLTIAVRVLEDLGATIPVASIAKGEKKGHADRIFIPGRANPLNMKRGSKELLLLMRIRDEAHRFGINAHRKKRGKRMLSR